MVELMPGTGVYLYQHDLDSCTRMGDVASPGPLGNRVARLLMNKFWRKEVFYSSTLCPTTPGKRLLDTTIVEAIIGIQALFNRFSFRYFQWLMV